MRLDQRPLEVRPPARPPRRVDRPLRLAVVGCGAIAREFHLPVLAGHEGVRLVALVDPDLRRMRPIADAYRVGTFVEDIERLPEGAIDAAVVASPPACHAATALALLTRGIHVLVEKPMATSFEDAESMVGCAEREGVILSVGLSRRLLPSARMLRALVEARHLGLPTGFRIEAGSVYGWGAATLGNLRKELAGGGVLLDMGTHVLDQLLFVLPGVAEVLDYRDNARGGVETDCAIRLRLTGDGDPVEGTVALSRTRALKSRLQVDCERGRFELPLGENARVAVIPDGLELRDALHGAEAAPYSILAAWEGSEAVNGYAAFRIEIDDWIEAIATGNRPRLDARTALPVVRMIDECYQLRRPLPEPWVDLPLALPGEAAGWPIVRPDRSPTSSPVRRPRVLITGASGLLGCRTAEVLSLRGGWDVRAMVRRPSNAARLARLPVEMIQGDVRDPGFVAEALRGCDAVIHCAIGTDYGDTPSIYDVTVRGTRTLAEAARRAGVPRLVHISTIAVYGNRVTGDVHETTPPDPKSGGDYARSKHLAESEVVRQVDRGLKAVTLRVGPVYGPFNETLIGRPIAKLRAGELALVGGDAKPSNTIYIDDVVAGILAALEAPERALGRAYNLAADDDLSWSDFYAYFAEGLGVAGPQILDGRDGRGATDSRRSGPRRWVRGWTQATADLARAPELRALARRVLETPYYGAIPREVLARFPSIERAGRSVLGLDGATIYRPESPAGGPPMVMDPISARFRIEGIQDALGYRPAIGRVEAMGATLDWIRWAYRLDGPPATGPDR